jgi:hypothetical protein
VLLPFGRIVLCRSHNDGAGLWAYQLIHDGFVEHAALAIKRHYLRLEAVWFDLGLEVVDDMVHHSADALWVLNEHGHLGGSLCEIVAILLTQAASDLLVGFVNRCFVDLQPDFGSFKVHKPMKDHNLLQAICRTNRTFGQEKTHGLIVDYIGIFDDVARALDFDERAVQQVISNIDDLRKTLPVQVQNCLGFFPGVDRSIGGYEGLMAAQQCLPNNDARDKFAAEYSVLQRIWEALSPDLSE